MCGEGLCTLLLPDIPHFGKGVARAGDKHVVIDGIQAEAHDVAEMIGKVVNFGASLDIPEHAGHIARGGEDTSIVDEAAAREISRMTGKFTGDSCRTFSRREVVD